jgi:hypothetical protein
MTSKKLGILPAAPGWSPLARTAGLAAAQDPTATPTPPLVRDDGRRQDDGRPDGAGMMGGRMGGAGMMVAAMMGAGRAPGWRAADGAG